MPVYTPAELARVATKAGVNSRQLVGPLPATSYPQRPGLFLRIHAESGNPNWAYWNGSAWGRYSGSKKGAMLLKNRQTASKKQLVWFGYRP